MNICMVSSFYFPHVGGAEVFTHEIGKRLVADGNSVMVLTGRWDSSLPEREKIKGVEIVRIPVLNLKGIRLFSFIFSSLFTSAIVRDFKADLLHANLCFSAGVAGAVLKKLTGIPLVVTVQGGDTADYGEHGMQFAPFLSPLISFALGNADIVHAISKYTKKRAELFGAKKVSLIPSGVDMKKFSPKINASGILKKYKIAKKGGPLIISVSRLSKKNGLEFLVRAMPAVLKKFPKTRLILVGEGEQRQELEQLIEELGLRSAVTLLGRVKHEDVPALICASDVFVRPSLNEGFGIAFLEAMACGTPVIGTNVGGIPDIIEDGKSGLLVQPSDERALAAAVSRVLGAPSLGHSLSAASLARSRLFDWESVYKRLLRLYSEAIVR